MFIIDQASVEDAARVKHGWPKGVKSAVIVIYAVDGVTEVLRVPTTTLYNDVRMPDGSHGQQFIAKAAFLVHINDEPRFGKGIVFNMPLRNCKKINGTFREILSNSIFL
jgi:hypothetical protein